MSAKRGATSRRAALSSVRLYRQPHAPLAKPSNTAERGPALEHGTRALHIHQTAHDKAATTTSRKACTRGHLSLASVRRHGEWV